MLVRTLEKLQVHLTVVPCQKKGTLTEFHDTVYRNRKGGSLPTSRPVPQIAMPISMIYFPIVNYGLSKP